MYKPKKTPIGEIPEDWEVVKVEGLFDFQRGYSYRKNDISEKPTQLRFITINDFEKEGGLKRNTEKIYLREDLKIDKKYFVEGSALFIANTDMSKGLIIGAPLLISQQKDEEQIVFSMDLTRLIPKKENISLEYIFYLLLSPSMRRIMKAFAQGTNVLHLNHMLVKGLKIPLPPLPEQKKISEILRTVDEAIEKTDLAIEKTERLKKGLMQRLLTKGIKHERFKKTEIGEIPEEWRVVRLGETTKVVVGYVGAINKFYTSSKQGIPLLSTTNITKHGISLENLKYVTREFHSKNRKSQVFSGDLIIARHGESGTAAVIPPAIPEAHALNVVIVRKSQEFDSKFLEYLFNFDKTRKRLVGWKSGSVQGVINTKVLEKFRIPLPPLEEQKKIAEILNDR